MQPSRREELHNLTGVVLVWEAAVVVEGGAACVGEIAAHEWIVGDLPEHIAEVAKGVADEDVLARSAQCKSCRHMQA